MSFPRYERYKDSGVKWLGEVPEHWQVLRTGRVARERRTKVNDSDFLPLSVTKGGVVPQLETAAKTDDRDNRRLVLVGDFVINSRSDRKGSSGLSRLDGSVSLINTVLQLTSLNGQFAHYLFRSAQFQEEFYRVGKGIVDDLWSTGFSEMSNILLALPPQWEQPQIALFLSAETAKIDVLIKEQQRLIELLKEKRQAVISHAVTKGLDPTVPTKDSGVCQLGRIPAHWVVRQLKRAVRGIEQGWSPQCEAVPVEGDEWGVLKVGAVNSGTLDPGENKRLPTEIPPVPCLGIRRGDVLVSRANTRELMGAAAVAEEDYPRLMLCDKLYRLTPHLHVSNPRFLVNLLRTPAMRGLIEQQATGASQSMQNISQEAILELPVLLPPLQEQAQILNSTSIRWAEFSNLIQQSEHAIALLQERRAALISAAVTGKIDVRHYAPRQTPTPEELYEPA